MHKIWLGTFYLIDGSVHFAGLAVSGLGIHLSFQAFKRLHIKEPIQHASTNFELFAFTTTEGRVFSTGMHKHGALGIGYVTEQDMATDNAMHMMSGAFCNTCMKTGFKTVASITGPSQIAHGGYHTLYVINSPIHRLFAHVFSANTDGLEVFSSS